MLIHLLMCVRFLIVDDFAKETKMRKLLYGLKNQSKLAVGL